MTSKRGLPGFAERRYEKRGAGIMLDLLAGAGVIATVVAGLMTAWVCRYLRLDAGEVAVSTGLGYGVLWAGMIAAALSKRDRLRGMLRWSGAGRSSANAPQMWHLLTRLPRELVVRGGTVVACTGVPVMGISTIFTSDEPVWASAPVSLAVSTSGLVAAALVMFGGDLLLRPMMEDVASYLPATFRPPELTWRLRGRLLAAMVAVALFGALTTAAFVDLADAGPERLSFALGIGLVAVVAMGLVFRVVTRSALDPLDDLLEGTRRVAAGDLETVVPVVTADDLGHLAASFNRMVVELRERSQDLRASRVRIVAAGNAERRRVERDLHDGAQQRLVLARLKLNVLGQRIAADPERAAALAEEVSEDLTRALEELRDLARGIYPSVLETDGLPAALRDAALRAAMPVAVHANGTRRLSRDVETAVYFCCLEALQNVSKHAGAGASVAIELTHDGDQLRFVVVDDGAGFEPGAVTSGTGIQRLTDRLGALGGTLEVDSARGRGTRLAGSVPAR